MAYVGGYNALFDTKFVKLHGLISWLTWRSVTPIFSMSLTQQGVPDASW